MSKPVAKIKHVLINPENEEKTFTEVGAFWINENKRTGAKFKALSTGININIGTKEKPDYQRYDLVDLRYMRDGKLVSLPLGEGVGEKKSMNGYLNYYEDRDNQSSKNETTVDLSDEEFPDV